MIISIFRGYLLRFGKKGKEEVGYHWKTLKYPHSKMRRSQKASGVIISYFTAALSTIISLIYTPVLLSRLGQNEYGVYTLVASTASYLSLISLGFGSAYIKFYTKTVSEKRNTEAYNGMYLMIYSIMGIVALIIGLFLVYKSDLLFRALNYEEIALAKKLLLILVISTSISFPCSVFDSIITAHERFVFQKVMILIKRILNPCLVMFLLFIGYKSIALVSVTLGLTILSGIVSFFYVVHELRISFTFSQMPTYILKEVTVYSFFIFIVMVSDQVSWNLDKFLLGFFKGSHHIAIYGVAAQLNNYVLTFGDIVSNVFTPQIHRISVSDDSTDSLTNLLVKVGRVQFFIVMLLFLGYVFLGKQFICLWAGTEYKSSYYVGLVLIGSITFPLIESVTSEMLRAMGLNKQYSYIVVLGVVINLLISIPLCKHYGALGCAIGTAISLFITSWVLRNYFLRRFAKIKVKRLLRQIIILLPSLLLPILMGMIIKLYFPIDNYGSLLAAIIAFTICFGISAWLFGMNDIEKKQVMLIIKHKRQ